MLLQLPLLFSLPLPNINILLNNNIRSRTSFYIDPLPLHFFYSLISSYFSLRSLLFGFSNDLYRAIFFLFNIPFITNPSHFFLFRYLIFSPSSITIFAPFLFGAFTCPLSRPILPSHLRSIYVSQF